MQLLPDALPQGACIGGGLRQRNPLQRHQRADVHRAQARVCPVLHAHVQVLRRLGKQVKQGLQQRVRLTQECKYGAVGAGVGV